jgi:ferrochelatase
VINSRKERDSDTVGVVLLNLGGPDSLSAVRPFLYNLFSDREIIKLGPRLLQKPIAALISLLRSAKSRSMYEHIGGRSPINDITKAQAEALEKTLNRVGGDWGANFRVAVGMRYWHPFIHDVVSRMFDDGIRQFIVLSLYPHYSKTTTGSAISEFRRAVLTEGIPEDDYTVQYIDRWYDHPLYIDSLAEMISQGIGELETDDFLLLYSAHGLPKSFIEEGDPYLDHLHATIRLANERLAAAPYHISQLRWLLSFQSRTGPVEWLEPSTEEIIEKVAGEGEKHLLVVPISFVSDHVETLYEIDILFHDLAANKGVTLKRCGSLNSSEHFIAALQELVMERIRNGGKRSTEGAD